MDIKNPKRSPWSSSTPNKRRKIEESHITSQPFTAESLPKVRSTESMSVFTGLISRRYINSVNVHDYHRYMKIKSVIFMIGNMTKLPNNQIINDNSNDIL